MEGALETVFVVVVVAFVGDLHIQCKPLKKKKTYSEKPILGSPIADLNYWQGRFGIKTSDFCLEAQPCSMELEGGAA